MTDDIDMNFEQRLRDLLGKMGDIAIPSLTRERLVLLRALISDAPAVMPSLCLAWRRVAAEAEGILAIVKMAGVALESVPVPLVRNGREENVRMDTVSCPLSNGELKAQVIPVGYHKARLVLSVSGECGSRGDLSVELSHGQKLIEARPLERKVEVALDGLGVFTVTLFSGEEVMGSMLLDIDEAQDSSNA